MKRKIITAAAMLVLMLAISGCGNKDNDASVNNDNEQTAVTEPAIVSNDTTKVDQTTEPVVEAVEEPSHEGEALSPLTGLWVDEDVIALRPFAVMINNLKEAMPQSGIEAADIIYEAPVEGAINRLMALYQNFDENITKIGPVRSARHYYLDMAFDFDAIYVHYGKSPQAQQAFKNLNAAHLDGLSYLDAVMFYQDPNRVRPHSTYTSYKGLYKGLENVGYRQELDAAKSDKFLFDENTDVLDSGNSATKVSIPFSWYSKPWFEYDASSDTYLRFQYGSKQIDVETGNQLAFTNVIVQIADIWLIRGDTAGRLDMELIGSGKGYYITGGKYIEITWEKENHETPTRYYDENGDRLVMRPGKTWIAIFPSDKTADIVID